MTQIQEKGLLNNIKESGKFGINAIFSTLTTVLLFSIVNIAIFIYAIYNGFDNHKTLFIFIVALIGFLFTFIAGYKMYRYILINAFSSIYKHIAPFFQKISAFVVDKSEDLLNGKTNLKNKKNSKSIDVKKMLNDKYTKVPGFIKFGMTFIINSIPFVEMLGDLKEEMDDDNKEIASQKLFGKMDDFIHKSVFDNNSKKWIYWLLPLNIVVQLIFIYLK